jgi:hypothetical protein
VIVCDTGLLVAAADRDAVHNGFCADLLASLHLARRLILVPTPVVERDYMVAYAGGEKLETEFLHLIVRYGITLVELEAADQERVAELVATYPDLSLQTMDAAVIAVAERLDVTEIATLQRRLFEAVQPRHTDRFTIVP